MTGGGKKGLRRKSYITDSVQLMPTGRLVRAFLLDGLVGETSSPPALKLKLLLRMETLRDDALYIR